MKGSHMLILFVSIVILSSCKKKENEGNEIIGPITLTIKIADSKTKAPLEGINVKSEGINYQYSAFSTYVNKSTRTDKDGVASLTYETEDEIYWYRKFVSMGSFSLFAQGDSTHYPIDIPIPGTHAGNYNINTFLVLYPEYIFDFNNITGNHLDDTLVFTCQSLTFMSHETLVHTIYSQKFTGSQLHSKSIAVFNYTEAIRYSLAIDSPSTLVSGVLYKIEGGTSIHTPIQF